MRKSSKYISSCVAAVVVGLTFVAIFAAQANRSVGVSLDLEVSRPNQMRIYWTTPGREFGEDRKGILALKSGGARYHVAFRPQSRPFHFQLNSGVDIHGLKIRSIDVRRIGRATRHFSAPELSDRLLELDVPGDWSLQQDSLVFDDSSRRMSFRFDNLNAGAKAHVVATAVPVLSGIVVALLGWLLLRRIDRQRNYLLRYSAIVLLMPWLLPWFELKIPFTALIWLKAVSATMALTCCALLICNLSGSRPLPTRSISVTPRLLVPIVMIGTIFWLGVMQIPQVRGFWTQPADDGTAFKARQGEFDSSFRRNFHFRKHFIEFNSEIKVSALATSPTHKVIIGRDGFMFEGRGHRRVVDDEVQMFDNISDYMGHQPLTSDELAHWANVLEQRRRWLAQQGMPYLFVMAPTKDMIYEEKLPARLRRHAGANRRFDQLLQYLQRETQVAVVDLRPAILAAKAAHRYPELYYRTDFHWNYFGAFFAYKAIVDAANEHFPQLNLKPLTLDEFSVDPMQDWVHHRFMHTLGLDPDRHRYEHYIRMQPQDRSRFPAALLPESGVQDVHWNQPVAGQRPETRQLNLVENASGELDTLLILGDSFIEKTILYFSVHARNTLYQRAVLDFPLTAFASHKPQLVVQEILNMYLLQTPPSNPERLR